MRRKTMYLPQNTYECYVKKAFIKEEVVRLQKKIKNV